MATVYARIAITAEGSGAAARDGIEHLLLRPSQGSAVPLTKAVARNTNDVGHLEGWPAHRFLPSSTGWKRDLFQRVDSCMKVTPRELEIDSCIFEPLMAHQYLNRAQVGAALEQVRRITVA